MTVPIKLQLMKQVLILKINTNINDFLKPYKDVEHFILKHL